jgi:hypothetical protein
MMTSSKLKMLPVVILASLAMSSNAAPVSVLSNTQTNAGRQALSRQIVPLSWHATPITTDGSAYSLTSVMAEIYDFNPAGTLFMEIWSVDGGLATPDASLARLTLSGSSVSNKTFTGNVPLSADTSYFIVTGVENGGGTWDEYFNFGDPVSLGSDFNTDGGSWTLETITSGATNAISYGSSDYGAAWSSDGLLEGPLRMEILADVVPEPTTVSLIGLGALATLFVKRKRSRSFKKLSKAKMNVALDEF